MNVLACEKCGALPGNKIPSSPNHIYVSSQDAEQVPMAPCGFRVQWSDDPTVAGFEVLFSFWSAREKRLRNVCGSCFCDVIFSEP